MKIRAKGMMWLCRCHHRHHGKRPHWTPPGKTKPHRILMSKDGFYKCSNGKMSKAGEQQNKVAKNRGEVSNKAVNRQVGQKRNNREVVRKHRQPQEQRPNRQRWRRRSSSHRPERSCKASEKKRARVVVRKKQKKKAAKPNRKARQVKAGINWKSSRPSLIRCV